MKLSLLLGLIAAVLFSGCAKLNTVARDFNVNEGTGQLIDAKQRAIIVVNRKDTNETIVCAEPSPDALSAYAMQMGLEGSIPSQGALKLAAASQESSAYIGLRTQSIQLLRDAMFRNCEAYANGAIDKMQYGIASRRHQRSMVALLAIEQLTGAIRVPPITITTEGAAEVAKSINELQSEANAIDKEIGQSKKDIKQIDDLNSSVKTPDILNTLEEKKSQLASLEKNKVAISKGIENARGVITTGKTYATVHDNGTNYRSDQDIKNVADTVYKIFENLNGADDFAQMCLSYLAQNNNATKIIENNNSFENICIERLKESTNAIKAKIKIDSKSADTAIKVYSNKNSSKEAINDASKKLEQISDDLGQMGTNKSINLKKK